MNSEVILVLICSFIIGIIIVEYGAYRTSKKIESKLSKLPEIFSNVIREIKEHPEKHPDLTKAYNLFLSLATIIPNIMEELEKEESILKKLRKKNESEKG